MAFIAPFVPALIKGGIGVGASLLGSKLSGGAGGVNDPKGLLNSQRQSIQQGRDIATSLQPQAQNLISQATSSFSPVADYYGRILSGNRNSLMSSLSPEVQQINAGYDTAQQSAGNLRPRGGGRSAFFADQPYARNRDITNLFLGSRPGAAQGLLSTGQAAASTGQGLYSSLLSALSGASSGTGNLLNYDLQSRSDQYNRGKDLGRTIFDLLGQLKLGGGGKSTLEQVQGGNVPNLPQLPRVGLPVNLGGL